MGAFKASIITNKGKILSAKTLAGTLPLQFTKLAISEDKLTGAVESFTDIGTIKQEKPISDITEIDDYNIKAGAVFDNTALSAGYYVRNVGLYALDPDEGEILYSISMAEEPADWMPPYSQNTSTASLVVNVQTAVSNVDNVVIEVNPTALVTIGQFNTLKNTVVLSKDTVVYVDGSNGNDDTGNGTQDKPYKTLQKAVNMCPVNTNGYVYDIILREGIYEENLMIADKAGTIRIKGADIVTDANKFVINSITCKNAPSVKLTGIKCVGKYNPYSNEGLAVQSSTVYVERCMFDDCIVRANTGGDISLVDGDVSNYRSGSINYGAIHANGGVIKCYGVTGTNNNAGYGGGTNSGTGGEIWFYTNCTLEADVLIMEDYSGHVHYNTGKYVQVGSGAGSAPIALNKNLYTDFSIVVHPADYGLYKFNLNARDVLDGNNFVTGCGGSNNVEIILTVSGSSVYISKASIEKVDRLADTTMEVYARRI